ncbi:MAG TPA: NUDIX domain-containing protein [Candidatus Saccharimonadales bacterium]|jgi:ADP-ribose pyrophosphatase YjhB (NUDIX family)|nr:NUDIX domain-containing protein [Candidatus Saccharimonadales bacterium]
MAYIPRDTSRAIVIKDGKVLLMERWRHDGRQQLHYFSIPGGGIEPGESPEAAAERELYEEMVIRVRLVALVATQHEHDRMHYYFLTEHLDGEPRLNPDSEEAARQTIDNNRYQPRWLSVAELRASQTQLFPTYQPLLKLLDELLQGKIPDQPWPINGHQV